MIKSMILNWFFPKRCFGCFAWGKYICQDCRTKLTLYQELICPVCAKLSVGGQVHSFCQKRYSLDGLIAVWHYQGLAKNLIKNFKYRLVRDLSKELVGLVNQTLQTSASQLFVEFWQFMGAEPIVVPVPLHSKRLAWRGFNQAETMARSFALAWQLDFSKKFLIRNKFTLPQAELKGQERMENVKNVFSLNPLLLAQKKILKGKTCLLIDDVWTTGSTMRACGQVLKKAGAEKVWALTLAR